MQGNHMADLTGLSFFLPPQTSKTPKWFVTLTNYLKEK